VFEQIVVEFLKETNKSMVNLYCDIPKSQPVHVQKDNDLL